MLSSASGSRGRSAHLPGCTVRRRAACHGSARAPLRRLAGFGACLLVLLLHGCAAVNTFPTVARAGDTVSVLVGGSADARKEAASIVLTDAQGVQWDLRSLGLVRSVFSIRSDGRARGLFDATTLEAMSPWAFGHEPLQTVVVADLPAALPAGMATLAVELNVSDNSAGAAQVMTLGLEIIPGAGQHDALGYFDVAAGGATATNFARLEPAPHTELSFGATGAEVIGAASLVLDLDPGVLDPGDINVYVPELLSRDAGGAFGAAQRMVYWRIDGGRLHIDIVAPQGIAVMFLKVYVLHANTPGGISPLHLSMASFYDTAGFSINLPVHLADSP